MGWMQKFSTRFSQFLKLYNCIFKVVYALLSIRYNSRIRIRTYADEISAIDSVTPIFSGAEWYEREVK